MNNILRALKYQQTFTSLYDEDLEAVTENYSETMKTGEAPEYDQPKAMFPMVHRSAWTLCNGKGRECRTLTGGSNFCNPRIIRHKNIAGFYPNGTPCYSPSPWRISPTTPRWPSSAGLPRTSWVCNTTYRRITTQIITFVTSSSVASIYRRSKMPSAIELPGRPTNFSTE